MARITASEARRRFFQLLDAVERGEEVVFERRGVRFRPQPDDVSPLHPPPRPPTILVLDPAVEDGDWTWAPDDDGNLRFHPLPPRGTS